MSLRKIGEELSLARTVRRYVRRVPEPPLPTPRPLRESQLDVYEDYLLERWSQGERNAARLYREISERRYSGYATMVRTYVAHLRSTTGNSAPFRSWMEHAIRSGIPELKSFVAGIERDYDAVHAALRLPWSQGITEGKVNKLKTLKRVMYGRAGFALLRQRLLHDA